MKISSILASLLLLPILTLAQGEEKAPPKASALENAVVYLSNRCTPANPAEALSFSGLKVEILNIGQLLKRSGDTAMLVKLIETTGQSSDMLIFLKRVSSENDVYKYTFDTKIGGTVVQIETSRSEDGKGQLIKVQIPEADKTTSASFNCASPGASASKE